MTYWVLLYLSAWTDLYKIKNADLCLNLYPCVIKYYLILNHLILPRSFCYNCFLFVRLVFSSFFSFCSFFSSSPSFWPKNLNSVRYHNTGVNTKRTATTHRHQQWSIYPNSKWTTHRHQQWSIYPNSKGTTQRHQQWFIHPNSKGTTQRHQQWFINPNSKRTTQRHQQW